MKLAIIGASGKTGIELVREALSRGHEVVGVCREKSTVKLHEFADHDRFRLVTASNVSDRSDLSGALSGCNAVIAILISVHDLKASDLVVSLAEAGLQNGVTRFVFTSGEVTVDKEPDESYTVRQWIMRMLSPMITALTPYSMRDMLEASALVREQKDWEWTIVRAPTLVDRPPQGYRFCEISEVTGKDTLSRSDYAACLLDTVPDAGSRRKTLTVV